MLISVEFSELLDLLAVKVSALLGGSQHSAKTQVETVKIRDAGYFSGKNSYFEDRFGKIGKTEYIMFRTQRDKFRC